MKFTLQFLISIRTLDLGSRPINLSSRPITAGGCDIPQSVASSQDLLVLKPGMHISAEETLEAQMKIGKFTVLFGDKNETEALDIVKGKGIRPVEFGAQKNSRHCLPLLDDIERWIIRLTVLLITAFSCIELVISQLHRLFR